MDYEDVGGSANNNNDLSFSVMALDGEGIPDKQSQSFLWKWK